MSTNPEMQDIIHGGQTLPTCSSLSSAKYGLVRASENMNLSLGYLAGFYNIDYNKIMAEAERSDLEEGNQRNDSPPTTGNETEAAQPLEMTPSSTSPQARENSPPTPAPATPAVLPANPSRATSAPVDLSGSVEENGLPAAGQLAS
ncbi:hypothetical protein HJFPF1_02132 [Paramyrothecium foliicola]|nr:hypothetical protein HJFPF1_02132 [Paramyrothecium foliicola]